MPASQTTIEHNCVHCPGRRVALSEGLSRAGVVAPRPVRKLGKYPDFTFERFQGI